LAYSVQDVNWIEQVLNWPSRQVGRIKARIGVKLFGAFLTTTLVIAALGFVSLQALTASHTRLKEASRIQENILIYSQINNDAARLQLVAADVLLGQWAGEKSFFSSLRSHLTNASYEAARYRRKIRNSDALTASDAQTLNDALDKLGRALEQAKRISSVEFDASRDDAIKIYTGDFKHEVQGVQNDFYNSRIEWERELVALIEQSQAAFYSSRTIVVGTWIVAVVIAVLLGSVFSIAITDPVGRLKRSFSTLAAGDFSQQVSVYNRDEFGDLAAHLNTTTQQLGAANRELQEANQHKSEFLANMSHELRTPLNAIIGFTRIVSRKCADILPAKQLDNLGKVMTSAEHLLSLINGILDLSKIEAGKMEVHAEQFDPAGVLKACARMAEPLKGEKPISIRADIPDDLPNVTSDRDMLRQITLNLLSNAVKFTQKGTITLSSIADDGQITVLVTDTGIGISPENLPKIFDEFTQAEGHTARKFGGTGLGLAISSKMAVLLGGKLTATSEEGAGSTFTLTIPLAATVDPESEA
jgi:signal transduction histidine kinase